MRTKLRNIKGQRKEFKGTFVRFGLKLAFKGSPMKTILLSDILNSSDGKTYCDHLWFNLTKEFAKIDLKEGDLVVFQARVKRYYKGYKGQRDDIYSYKPIEEDYKLSHPTKVRLIRRMSEPQYPIVIFGDKGVIRC